MSELKKWRVTGPDGFEIVEGFHNGHNEASVLKWMLDLKLMRHCGVQVMRQAGYRAEPIEEPKMVTVRADLLVRAHNVIDQTTEFDGLAAEIRAALKAAK